MNFPRRFAVLTVSSVSLLAVPALVLLMFDHHADSVSGTSQQANVEDWGDAPAPYPQQAHHLLPPLSAIWMGDPMSPPDGESGPQPDPNGLGDDHSGTPDDEDGVVFGTLIPCQASAVWVQASGPDGILNGWIDYDDDGNWGGLGEHVVVNQLLTPGQNYIPLVVPCNARPTRQTFTRFRLSTGPTDYQDTGAAQSLAGEVEDHAVEIRGPDLSVVKIDDHDPALTGDVLIYTISVTNNGPVNEPAAVIYDTIPDGLLVLSAVPDQGTCNIISSPLRCQLGLIPVSGVVNVIIQTRVGGSAQGDILNHVLVEGNGPDPIPSNNEADEITTIHQQGLDVDVVKSDFPDPVWSMDPITYTLSVHNYGAQPALAVQLTDTLPMADVDFAGTVAIPSQGVCAPQGQPDILCNLGDIAAGSSANVIVSVPRVLRVPPDFGTAETIYNTATVSLDPNDLAPENNVDVEATTVVSPCVEVMLVIDKSGSMANIDTPGGNTRLEDAKAAARVFVQSVDPLVTKVGLVWFNHQARLAHVLSRDMASVIGAINGMPPPGGDTAMGFGVIAARNELDSARHNPLATRAMIFLGDGFNTTGPPPVPEAAIAKGMGIHMITIGLGPLPPGDKQVLIDMASSLDDFFEAPTSDQLEAIYADLGEGICEVSPPSGPQPLDLAITKLDAPYDPSPLCKVITYTLAITNLTQGVMAENVIVTDTLPAGVTFVGAIPTIGGQPPRCAQSANLAEVNCELGDLAGGASTSVLIALQLTAPMQSPPILSIDNSARVDCDNPEINEENNVDDESTSFVLNDLILTKVADPATLTPPGWITYTLTVTSTGACDNPNVLVTDTLPSAFRYRGSVTSLGVVGYADGLHAVTATLGLMHDNEVATIAITGTVPCTATGTLTNTAITTGMMPESDLANNTDSAATVLGLTRCSDLGDTPDRYNHSMAPMTAYPGVLAIFPTVYERSALQPAGPKHKAAKDDAWLGLSVSGEQDADLPPDDDSDTNISPISNIANRDGHDDGATPGAIAACGPTLLTYKVKVSNLQGTQSRTRYTNVWYDFNRDGDFGDTFVCTSGNGGSPQTVKEWAGAYGTWGRAKAGRMRHGT